MLVNTDMHMPGVLSSLCRPPPQDQDKVPLWLSDAEYQSKIGVLTWEGIGGGVAKWHSRWLTVWRGRWVPGAGASCASGAGRSTLRS